MGNGEKLERPKQPEKMWDKCPRCGSPDPARHPAVQFEGETQICEHLFHTIGQQARDITMQIDYKNIYATFKREFGIQVERILHTQDADVVRLVHSVLHPISVCLQCSTDKIDILDMRDVTFNASAEMDKHIQQAELRKRGGRARVPPGGKRGIL